MKKLINPIKNTLTALLLSMPIALLADSPPTTPILRINTEMHTAMINGAVNAEESELFTVSDDKTVKVWDIATGALLRTLRVPIAEGHEGKLFSVAIDPNAQWLAVAGWTGYAWDKKASIYILNPQTGKLIQRLSGLPNVIVGLCVSHDGARLAAMLAGNNGVRQWQTHNWTLFAKDSEYEGRSYGCAYSNDKHLLTSSYDGKLRLYNPDGNLHDTISANNYGKKPFRLAIAPDGQHFAVGYHDIPNVGLGTLKPLALTGKANTKGLSYDYLSAIAWSKSGNNLYAGTGDYTDKGIYPVLRWKNHGKGKREVLSGANCSVDTIIPLKNQHLISTSCSPSWILQSNQGNIITNKKPPIFNNIDKISGYFLISDDTQRIYTGRNIGDEKPVTIDTTIPSVNKTSQAPQNFNHANVARLNIDGWKDTENPTFNGNALPLKQYELSRSLAINSRGNSFLLGTEWSLRRFDVSDNGKNASQAWEKSVSGTAWGVNLSADNRLAVVALADGTFRWYNYDNGEELLAMFIHKETLEWVMWTPQGYYNASANGDELIGWHLNRGKDEKPDFFPASKFRKQFYRPRVVHHILNTLNIDKAIELAKKDGEKTNTQQTVADALPPALDIVNLGANPRLNRASQTLELDIRSDNSDLKSISVLANGKKIKQQAVTGRSGRYSINIDIPQHDHLLSVFAENGNGSSVVVGRQITWTGERVSDKLKPALYVLAIGVTDYDDDTLDLHYPSKDATDFAKLMQQQKGLYRDVKVKLLTDATRADIITGFDWLLDEVTDKDVAMLFFAGHGAKDKLNNYQLLARDSHLKNLHRTGVSAIELKQTLSSLPGKRLAFLDACYSGNLMGKRHRGLAPRISLDDIASELSAVESGVIVFSSSTGKQLSQEDARWSNGAFTKALIEGLSGKADYEKNGKITVKFLDAYISERVKKMTGNAQTPTLKNPEGMPDFPIAVPQ